MRTVVIFKGGEGSGNFGHEGRPGLVGGSRSESDINLLHGLQRIADVSLPKDTAEYRYFYHSVRYDSNLDNIVKHGFTSKTWASKDEIRDRGAGFVIFRVPKSIAVREGIDHVEEGLSYREFVITDPISPDNIVRIVREVPIKGTQHTIREDKLAKYAIDHQGESQPDLPEYYQKWFNIIVYKGGEGSGNFGHEGRPGLVGGSSTSYKVTNSTFFVDNSRENFNLAATKKWVQDVESFGWDVEDAAKHLYRLGVFPQSIDLGFDPNWGLEKGDYVAYRGANALATEEVSNPRGLYFSPLEKYAAMYNSNVYKYTVHLENPLVIDTKNDIVKQLYNGKTFAEVHGMLGSKLHSERLATAAIDKKIYDHAKKSGYDSIVIKWSQPPSPRELVVINANVTVEKEFNTSVMIGFDMSDDEFAQSIVNGDAAKPPHVTLVMLGTTADLEDYKQDIINRLEKFAFKHSPISGTFGGFAVFPSHNGSIPVVLLFDSPYITPFRQALYHQFDGLPIAEANHGFTAHMTVTYTDAEHVMVPTEEVTYDKTINSVSLFWGSKIIKFDLTGDIVEKQLPIDDKSRSVLIDIRNNIFKNTTDALAERVYTGELSIGAWEEAMKAEIKALHTSTAVIGKGSWENMTQSDWGRVGQLTRQQYRYLHGFAETIADKPELSLRAIQARAQMYGNAAKHTSAVLQAGEFAGGTRRHPGRFKGLPWMPGDGSTECLVNCKCHWKLTEIDKTKDWKLVQAVWTLTPAEHCDDCIDRRNYTEIINVPVDTVVPPTIGGL